MAICVICIKRSQRYNVQTISCSNSTFLCLLKGFYTCDGCMYIVVREAKICNHLPIIICLVLINTLCCWKSQLGTTHECVYLHSIFVKTIHGRSSKNKKDICSHILRTIIRMCLYIEKWKPAPDIFTQLFDKTNLQAESGDFSCTGSLRFLSSVQQGWNVRIADERLQVSFVNLLHTFLEIGHASLKGSKYFVTKILSLHIVPYYKTLFRTNIIPVLNWWRLRIRHYTCPLRMNVSKLRQTVLWSLW